MSTANHGHSALEHLLVLGRVFDDVAALEALETELTASMPSIAN